MNHLCVVNDITGSSVDIPFNKSWVCVKYQCFIRRSLSCTLTVYIVLRVCYECVTGEARVKRKYREYKIGGRGGWCLRAEQGRETNQL